MKNISGIRAKSQKGGKRHNVHQKVPLLADFNWSDTIRSYLGHFVFKFKEGKVFLVFIILSYWY